MITAIVLALMCAGMVVFAVGTLANGTTLPRYLRAAWHTRKFRKELEDPIESIKKVNNDD